MLLQDTVHPEFYTLASVTITQVDEQRRLNAGSSQDSSQSLDGSATRPKTPRHSLVSQFGVDLSDFTESSSSKVALVYLSSLASTAACFDTLCPPHCRAMPTYQLPSS